ncbi:MULTISPECIES: hypothetical protein [Enterobacter]|uniref:hypothetical protein n=1 Tax=Enterobacter TaxID=547 RepID=UPI0022369E86|nr:hypothetical protein [Enterobacter mori]MCW4985694.1 hypothetical protein [Enterobacter mori]
MKNDKEAAPAGRGMELVRHIDSWKKLIIFMVLALFCVTLYSAWEHRRDFAFWAMSSFGNPRIDEVRVGPEVSAMMADINALGAVVWSVNLEKNKRKAIYVRVGNERLTNLEGTGDLVLRAQSPLTAEVIGLIDIKMKCWELTANTVVGKRSSDAGVKWVCAAAIPPQFGTMIGVMSVGFAERPENEDYVKMRIRQAAERIIR